MKDQELKKERQKEESSDPIKDVIEEPVKTSYDKDNNIDDLEDINNKNDNTNDPEYVSNKKEPIEGSGNTDDQNDDTKDLEDTSNRDEDSKRDPNLSGKSITGNNVINHAKKIISETNINETNVFTKSGYNPINFFSEKDLQELESKQIPYELREYLAENKYFNKAINILKTQGLLFLFGNSRASIFEISILIADELKQSEKLSKISFCRTFKKNNRINFNNFLTELESNSILILDDPLKEKNEDFINLVENINPTSTVTQTPNFVVEKAKKNIYTIIIFSNDYTDSNYINKLNNLNYGLIFDNPNESLREKYLTLKIESLENNQKLRGLQNQFDINIKYLYSNIDYFSKELTFIDQITRFIESIRIFLSDNEDLVLDSVTISSILNASKNVKSWIVEDIGKDLEHWSFVLTLTLMSCSPNNSFNEISLIDFEYLSRKIEGHLKKDVKSKKRKKRLRNITGENNLFSRCKAVKKNNIANSRLCIAFEDDKYSSEIWSILREDFSLTIIKLIPILLKTIKSKNFRLKKHAAQILGQIGQIDFDRTINLISEWSNADNENKRFLVGNLFEGIHSSNNKKFIKKCEQQLHQNRRGNFREVWTSVATYLQIGNYNYLLAMKCLGDIVEYYFSEVVLKFRKFPEITNQDFNKIAKKYKDINDENIREILYNDEDIKYFINREKIMRAVTYSITSLCLAKPLSIAKEILKWLDRNNKTIKTLCCKMLVSDDGVLNKLNQKADYFNNETDQSESWNIATLFIAKIESVNGIFLELIEKAYFVSKKDNPTEHHIFVKQLSSILAKWGESSVNINEAKQAIVSFLSEILHKHNELLTSFNKYLNQWKNNKSLKLKTLATEIENGIEELKAHKKKQPREWNL